MDRAARHKEQSDPKVEAQAGQNLPALPGRLDVDVIRRAAASSCTMLITGETGVGKGFLARWIHMASPRCASPFIPINCGAIPHELIDSQLFGHARGSFTGAVQEHLGMVRAAQHGTLFLDEVSELPMSAQARLLRLLQEREVQPVGHSRPVIVDVRVIAATNTDLKTAVVEKRFREDLLFRLDVIRVAVPPLRERVSELGGLVEAFNEELAGIYGQPPLTFEPAAMDLLRSCAWPGNIRQLRTVIERLHVLAPGSHITPRLLREVGQIGQHADSRMIVLDQLRLDEVRKVLADSGGSMSETARVFGVHRSTLYRWLRQR